MPTWINSNASKRPTTIGSRIDNLIYERTRSVGQIVDDILYTPGPIAKPVALTAGAAFGLYAAKIVFRRLVK